ncbi:MAG: MMPL family transporter [Candidatus Latescibacteria bacterium]|nr:MMPL family transporter [bacterium]MBD3425362.1 MMPL family transporter [Candidatus Latescibacterota bacterium]
MRLTEITLKRPVATTVLVIALVAMGLYGLATLDVDYLPDIAYPMIKIHIWWRGATPEEIETNVAEPIERVMATVDDLDYIESSSIEGMYTLLVNCRYGTDVDEAFQDVVSAMARAERELPEDMEPPLIIKADPSFLPVTQVIVRSDSRSLVWLRDWADNWLIEKIATVGGTAGAEIVGGLEREIRIHLDPGRMSAYGLSPASVVRAVSEANREIFAGRVTAGDREIIARTMGELTSLEEIEGIVVSMDAGGKEVYLRDVAEVEDSHEKMRINTRFNGQTCIKLNVLKQAEANTVEVARGVRKKMEELKKDAPDDIEFSFVEDQGSYITGAISSVEATALLAALLVIVVVFIFLGRFRYVLVMMAALLVTLLANFFVMRLLGFSLNLFSLGGMVVALGVILDNSIVVLENIIRLGDAGDKDPAFRGTDQVGAAIITATLTFFVIFIPFIFIPGLTSLLFRELVMVVAGIVAISLLIAVTLTPSLAGRVLARSETNPFSGVGLFFHNLIDRLKDSYTRSLEKVLKHGRIVIASALAVFALSLVLIANTGSEFLPKLDDGRIKVKVMMPSGTAVGRVDRILSRLESRLEDIPEIESIFSLAGGRVWGLATFEIAHEGELNLQLVPKSRRDIDTREFIRQITPLVKKVPVPGGKVNVMQRRVEGIRKTGEQEVEVKVKGTDMLSIFEFAGTLADRLSTDPGIRNVNISMDMTKPEYKIVIDRKKAASLGLSVRDVASTLRTLVHGTVATRYREGLEYYDIRVMIPERRIGSKPDIEDLVIMDRGNASIRLRDVAEVIRSVGPVEIVREDQVKQVIVRMDPAGISTGEVVERVEAAAGELEAPAGTEWEFGGQAYLMAENRKTMGLIILFASLFAYIILAVQFESFLLPFLIMINIPLALTGAFLALFIAGTPVGVTVLVGLVVMMAGIISQGVVLLTLSEEYTGRGQKPSKAVATAAPIRLRPILMTQLTTVIGLVPLALNLGEGADMLRPMAIAVIGGLLYSLLLTLFFLPSAYTLVMRNRD